MNAKILVMALMLVLTAALISPAFAYMPDEPGTIINVKDFVVDSFSFSE